MGGSARAPEPVSPHAPQRVTAPVMLQRWESIAFLHWRYDPPALARFLPAGLALDTAEGGAWVSITPFVCYVRPPLASRGVFEGRFPETNVRTYVRGPDGRRGIWFFSLDAARLYAVAGARTVYSLPYKLSRMKVFSEGALVRYKSERRWPERGPRSDILVETGEAIPEPGSLDHFLTARFRLYTVVASRLMSAQVDHPPWPLRHARAVKVEQSLIEAAGLPRAEGDPLVHYSPGVEVRIGAPHLVEQPKQV